MIRWTPLQLNILLHYYCCCDEFRWMPIRTSLFDELIADGLMTPDGARPPQTVTLTDRGRAFVEEGLLSTPLPVWRMPT
jgi:hypothetical protein